MNDPDKKLNNNQTQKDSVDKKKIIEQAFGMWKDRDDINDEWLAEGRKNWRSRWDEDEEEGEGSDSQ